MAATPITKLVDEKIQRYQTEYDKLQMDLAHKQQHSADLFLFIGELKDIRDDLHQRAGDRP